MDIRFGLALDWEEQLATLTPEYVAHFEMLKLALPLWESSQWRNLNAKFSMLEIHLSEIADSTLCRMAPELEIGLQLDFIAKFEEFCERAASEGVVTISSSFDVDKALSDKLYFSKFVRLLNQIEGILGRLNLNMLLPLRLPRECELGDIGRLMMEFSSENIGLELKLHPHEPSFIKLPEGALRPVRFSVSTVDIVYEPLLGNKLDVGTLQKHLKCLGEFAESVRLFFRPVGLTGESLTREMCSLKNFIEEIKR